MVIDSQASCMHRGGVYVRIQTRAHEWQWHVATSELWVVHNCSFQIDLYMQYLVARLHAH